MRFYQLVEGCIRLHPTIPMSRFSDVSLFRRPTFRNFKLNVQISNFFLGNFFLFKIKNCNPFKEFEINENFKYVYAVLNKLLRNI